MPWRDNTDPYFVMVSELMLQQTQVDRVIPQFNSFIKAFPSIGSLAQADLSDVIKLWQGLGYNRRAKFLHQAAQQTVQRFNSILPSSTQLLQSLPGIGPNTAAAIAVYAFNQPAVFVETNIRTVYIHHFFADDFGIDDKQIRELLEQMLDRNDPRRFYWALMDYGTFLKKNGIKAHVQSKHYAKQSKLEGSLRQMRGRILKNLTEGVGLDDLLEDPRFEPALVGLVKDGLVGYNQKEVKLAK
jgi:A/G-specific adenine glycosylase